MVFVMGTGDWYCSVACVPVFVGTVFEDGLAMVYL